MCCETKGDDLLRNKIACQDRIIAQARHELSRLQEKAHRSENELRRLKTVLRQANREFLHATGSIGHNWAQARSRRLDDDARQAEDLQFKALVEFSTDHMFILDPRGRFLFSNNQVQQLHLKTGKILVGMTIKEVYPSLVFTLFDEKLHQVLTEGQGVTFHHQRESESDGDTRHHLSMLYPIFQKGRIWAVGGISRDISNEKGIEKQLFQVQKMEALGTLVAGVAHEINNPINLILFNLPLFGRIWLDLLPIMYKSLGQTPKVKIGGLSFDFIEENLPRLISDMEMAANRVAQIVTGLKDFSRKSNPADKGPVQVNLAVQNARRLACATLNKSNTVLELDLAENLPPINANLQNLEQVTLNLIINAMQSIDHDHGKVTIRTREVRETDSILIEVADNGRGVNPAVADKIFDPFVTDRQTAGGTGLGLSVTYNLVKAHRGDVTFHSEPGRGSRFTVSLPVAKKRKRCRIMVVDDDQTFRGVLVKAISKWIDCTVEAYANGAEALIRLGQNPPDLLILDMFMPEIDGLGVCRAIKNELGLEQTKVVIVTGFPDHPNLAEARRMGFSLIVTKPLAVEAFIVTIKKTLHGIDTAEIADSDRGR